MKTTNTAYALALAALAAAACDGPMLYVKGTIADAADSTLFLALNSPDGLVKLDSAKLDADGRFIFREYPPRDCPEFYVLYSGSHIIHLAADSAATLTVTASLPTMERDYTVEGNESSKRIKEISLMQMDVQQKIVAIERNEDMYPGDQTDSIRRTLWHYKEWVKTNHIYPDPASAAAYYAVCQSITDLRGPFMLFNPLTDRDDAKCLAAVATAWDGFHPNAPRTVQLCNLAIRGMRQTAPPGNRIINVDEEKITQAGILDISLPDIDGHTRSVLDLRGKVVMIDFTAHAAKESPQRTLQLRALHERYHAQGFEIYQISLDRDEHFWKYSCESLPWICVRETDGAAARTYNVTTLPTFFLVNRDNEIVTRGDLMEGSLEDNIKKLL